jgi:protein TonB
LITYNIKWFLGFSVAAHAAVLIAWQTPVYTPGNSGHVIQVSVNQYTDKSSRQASRRVEQPADPGPEHSTPARVVTNTATHRKQVTQPVHSTSKQQRPITRPVMPAAAVAAVTSKAVITHADTDRHLRNSVMELITRELTYPAIARRKGWQGVVKLEVHIEPDGSITDLQVEETSGYVILDKAAMHCLQLASIPDATRWLQGQAIDIVVPVEYRLVGG